MSCHWDHVPGKAIVTYNKHTLHISRWKFVRRAFFFKKKKILVLCAHIEHFSTVKDAGEFLSLQGDSLFTSGGGGGLAQVTGFSLGSVLAEQPEFGGLSCIAQCGIPTQGLHLRYFNIFYRSYCLRGSLGDPERNFSPLINHDGWASGDPPQTPGPDTRLVKGHSYRRLWTA